MEKWDKEVESKMVNKHEVHPAALAEKGDAK